MPRFGTTCSSRGHTHEASNRSFIRTRSYLSRRIAELRRDWKLRVLLCHVSTTSCQPLRIKDKVDIDDNTKPLHELNVTAVRNEWASAGHALSAMGASQHRTVAVVVAHSFFLHVPWLLFSVVRVLTGTSHLAVARAVV